MSSLRAPATGSPVVRAVYPSPKPSLVYNMLLFESKTLQLREDIMDRCLDGASELAAIIDSMVELHNKIVDEFSFQLRARKLAPIVNQTPLIQ